MVLVPLSRKELEYLLSLLPKHADDIRNVLQQALRVEKKN
jgi:hypothetical protein